MAKKLKIPKVFSLAAIEIVDIDGVTMNRPYTLKDNDNDIQIGLFFGEGTPTINMSIYLDNTPIETAYQQNFNMRVIGTNNNLKNKNLYITARVTDTSQHTNSTSVLFRVLGGVLDKDYKLKFEVNEQGGTVLYNLKLRF